MARITHIGNEGFCVEVGSIRVLLDAFYKEISGLEVHPDWRAERVERIDLILVTHAHYDHFDAPMTARAALRTGAKVLCPRMAARELAAHLPKEQILEMEPPETLSVGNVPQQTRQDFPWGSVTTFRTFHVKGHNSYLLEINGYRFFHDGDNEDVSRFDQKTLGSLDALFIAPWLGSGWADFIERVLPRHWFIMHLEREEFDRLEAGTYFQDITDHVPANLCVLRPGEIFDEDTLAKKNESEE